LHADGTCSYDGLLTTGSWVHAVAHQTKAEAARTVRTARVLRSGMLPNTQAALAAGALSGRHAAVIADAVKDAPSGAVVLIEPEAVATAVDGDVVATAHLMRRFQHALDPDSADEKALRRYERAGITFSPLLDGGFAIVGTADETTGAALVAAMTVASPLVKGDTRTAARRRLDGLHRICQHWLDTATPDGRPDSAAHQQVQGAAGRHPRPRRTHRTGRLTGRDADLGRSDRGVHRPAAGLRQHRHLCHPQRAR
jgi:hypothetical protein